VLLSVSTIFAAGSSEAASGEGPTVLSVTYAPGDMTSKQAMHETIAKFNQSQSEYMLKENTSLSTGAYLDVLKTLNASGQMPDMFECRDTPVFVRAEMLEPLDDSLKPLFEKTVPVYGTVYTAPIVGAYPSVILYNKALFEELGLNQAPKNYGEFLEICDALKAHGIAPLAAGVADIWHIGFLYNYFFTNYCTHGDDNFISKVYAGEAKFDNPGMIEAMTKLSDLFRDGDVEAGFMSTKESQMVSLLVGEKAAMLFVGPFMITQIEDADPDFEVGFFPLFDDDGNVILQGGATHQGWALTKEAAKDPAKKAGFDEFIRFFFAQEQYSSYLQQTNSFPTTAEKMVYATSEIMGDLLTLNNTYPKAMMWNTGVGANELPPSFRNWTYKKVQEMLMGQLEPEQLVKEMDTEWATLTRDFDPTKLESESL
jgi:raffinose/stachyose/melibiose transport system substrate-binding protein